MLRDSLCGTNCLPVSCSSMGQIVFEKSASSANLHIAPRSLPRLAVVGGGPAAVYLLKHLMTLGIAADVTIFEQNEMVGWGMPYTATNASDDLLANISSAELPPLATSLHAWLLSLSDTQLSQFKLQREQVSPTEYYPRHVLGEYFAAQFTMLAQAYGARGGKVTARTSHHVDDVVPNANGHHVLFSTGRGHGASENFTCVVIASGHQHAKPTFLSKGENFFHSPYPLRNLRRITGGEIGILGSALTAIDAALHVARCAGRFVAHNHGLAYHLDEHRAPFRITMMSRKGLLPELDFYYPLPLTPLEHLRHEAVSKMVEGGQPHLLEKAFLLFKRDLAAAVGNEHPLLKGGIEQFHFQYFAARAAQNPFIWAHAELPKRKLGHTEKKADPQKLAILKAHQIFESLYAHLTPPEQETFNAFLKPVFTDNYTAIPLHSVEKLLALHDAGCLEIATAGSAYQLYGDARDIYLKGDGRTRKFQWLVDGTGQKALAIQELPFPILSSLMQMPLEWHIHATQRSEVESVQVDEAFQVLAQGSLIKNLFVVAAPFLLHQLPFAQGLDSVNKLTQAVAHALASAITGQGANSACTKAGAAQ